MDLVEISRKLAKDVSELSFAPPVACTYNPLEYARETHEEYLRRYGQGPHEIVLLGMNPGPWGMAQTGIPFGEIASVRDWMRLDGTIGRPDPEHPKRPVTGFDCHRSEVSGRRVWEWAASRWGTPERFFSRFFVINYCPLSFMEESGRNRTPNQLPVAERRPLFEACDAALRASIEVLEPTWVVGIGAFAEKRAKKALRGVDVRIGRVLHPSPASPAANRGWVEAAERDLAALGIDLP